MDSAYFIAFAAILIIKSFYTSPRCSTGQGLGLNLVVITQFSVLGHFPLLLFELGSEIFGLFWENLELLVEIRDEQFRIELPASLP